MSKLTKVVAASLLLASSTFAADFVLKFSHVVSDNTPKGQAALFFEKRVEELSKGRIDVQVYPSSQLYDDSAVMKALKLDSVQMACPSFSKFTKIVPELAFFDLPFLFRDVDHLHKVQDGPVGTALKDMVSAKGYIALDYWDNGFKQFSSSKNALLTPKDAEGQKFRIMSSKVLEAQFKAVGANPQVLPFSEVYSALQQGVIDAAENPISNIYTKKFYDVQKYLTISNHGYLGYLVVVSQKFWKSLPDDLKSVVKQAMKEATAKNSELAIKLDAEQLGEIEKYAKDTGKLEINTLNAEQTDAWRKAVSVIYKDFDFKDSKGNDLVQMTIDTK